ncbi:hypothetical protein [Variovorax sp. MHTC-1]|uniref:hypothetical protein n=1 Tax=Variovorax sp. MHTC-1 TaxID=2495593 RepID=UPI000F866E5F|nr:hypothetical protein [Variovorax sp. MHTC-1]RST52632.1 hypothetical protein EJI01_15595 [Variovorax sp. MHTC-1]
MSETLALFEERLRAHFSELSQSKASGGHRLFALEHCLAPDEVKVLSAQLGKSLGRRRMLADFKVSWVVHAAEQGYDFDGQEYWHSFAQRTANWEYYGNRKRLRDWFRAFCAEFSGVQPQGEWAKHYKYIAWPIANALLPRDLQEQLAQSIFNIRFQLRTVAHLPPEATGKLIAQHSYVSSSRFRFLLQQHDLVGRLVHTLLQGDGLGQTSIYPATLQRITTDLNSRGHARAWLRDAQKQYAQLQFQLPGIKQNYWTQTLPHASTTDAEVVAVTDRQGVLLRPTIELRRTALAEWQVVLSVPSFQPLVDVQPELRPHLERVRYTVSAHGTALFLGRTLLSSRGMQYTLADWPAQRQCVLSFNAADTFFDRIVGPECQIQPAKVWVFRLSEDGTARHIATAHVVPGQSYLVITREPGLIDRLGPPVVLRCAGVTCVKLTLDTVISQAQKAALLQAGISFHLSVRVSPLGLLPRQWGEEGLGVWLTSETPCFTITRDHEFDAYQLAIDDGEVQTFACDRNAPSMNFMLQGLSVGRHKIAVATRVSVATQTGSHFKTERSVELSLFIRQPTAWTPGKLSINAMVVDVHPPAPTIEDLLRGRIALSVEGDRARRATCMLVLTNASNEELSAQTIFQRERLPIAAAFWEERLNAFLNQTSDEQIYLEAAGGFIRIDAEDLGEYRVALLHHPEPLRWGTTVSKSSATLRLINDGFDKPLQIERLSFSQPMQRISVDPARARIGIDTRAEDGLFVVRAQEHQYAAVVSSTHVGKEFGWLGVELDEHKMRQSRDDEELVDTYALWANARTCGAISRIKRMRVLDHIHDQLIAVVCGIPWAKLEKRLASDVTADNWGLLDDAVSQPISYAVALGLACKVATTLSDETIENIHRTKSMGFRISQDLAVVRTAWLLAFNPALLLDGDAHPVGTSKDAFATLVRGARLLLLCRKHERAGAQG